MKITPAIAGLGLCALAMLAGAPPLEAGFDPAVSYAAGANPRWVGVGDFNGDGKQDMAVANQTSNNVSVLLGNGNGTFQTKTDYATGGTNSAGLAVGDFNGDGKLDLAVTTNAVIGILLGNGNGTFQAALTYPCGTGAISLAMADLNGDGILDLAVVNFNSNTVSVLVGNANGSFQAPLTSPVGTQPIAVVAGDFNGDGKPDLAASNYGAGTLSILLGNGNATFAPAANYAVGTNPYTAAVGDFNGDGKQDLAVGNATSNNVSVLLGNGNGTFASAVNYAAGTNPIHVTVGDFNGDGKQDLAVANFNSSNVSILLGNGSGVFPAPVNYPVGTQPNSASVGDFNGDGKPDLAVPNSASGSVSVLINNASALVCACQPAVNYALGASPLGVAVGDFNRDGKLDLATANNTSNSVSILLGNGDGTYQAASNFPTVGMTIYSVAVGDFNRDGNLDLATANYDSNTVSILLGNGAGSFGAAVQFAVGPGPIAVAAGDFNRDGRLDLVVANSGSTTVSILLGNGDGTFQAAVNSGAGNGPFSVAVGDVNRDGKLDVVTANPLGGSGYVMLGNGTATLQAPIAYSAGATPWFATLGDFNGDGKLDIAVANQGGPPSVSIVLGNGDGTFPPIPTFYAAGSVPLSLAVADFNGDGKLDLAAGNNGSSNVSILLGNGNGTFPPPVNYAVGAGPRSIAVADFNRDGKPDLAVANTNSNDVSILLDDCRFVTATALGSSLNPSLLGQSVTFTANVTSGTGGSGIPTGTVTFFDGATALGTSPLVSGTATLSTSSLTVGAHSITATYNGDGTFATSTSAPHFQDVIPLENDLSITKTDGQTMATPGSPITYTIVVSNAGPAPANGATVTDTVPGAITGATWTCVGASGGTCTASGGPNLNDTVNLPVGGSVTYTLTGTLSASVMTSPLSNTASVAPPSGYTDPNPSNNSATDSDTIPFVCGAEIVMVPNGRLSQATIGAGATLWFGGSVRIGNSYSVEFKNDTGSGTAPGTLTVFRGDDPCGSPTTLTTNDTSGIDPAGTGGVARQSFTAAGTQTYFRAKLQNGSGAPIPFSFAWSDTTQFSPAWSTSGAFDTYYSIQNTTGATLNGTLTLRSAGGAVVATFPVTVPAGQTVGTNTSALGVGRNQTGTARFRHDGPPGAFVLETAIANFSISPAYVQPVKFLPVRDGR